MSAYRISEAASQAGFTTSALRFYEASGLVPEPARTPAGYRMYDDAAVERLRFVHRARTLGLPLDEVRGLVRIWDAGACAPVQHDLAAHIAGRRRRLLERVTELQTLAAQLREAEAAVLAAPGSDRCGEDCACMVGAAVPTGTVPTGTGRGRPRRRPEPVGVPLLPRRSEPPPAEPLLACTLDAGQTPGRLRAWQDLVAGARSRQALPRGERLQFDDRDGLAGRIVELCALEQQCCSFFGFVLTMAAPEGLTLDVTAPDGAAGLVAALLDGGS